MILMLLAAILAGGPMSKDAGSEPGMGNRMGRVYVLEQDSVLKGGSSGSITPERSFHAIHPLQWLPHADDPHGGYQRLKAGTRVELISLSEPSSLAPRIAEGLFIIQADPAQCTVLFVAPVASDPPDSSRLNGRKTLDELARLEPGARTEWNRQRWDTIARSVSPEVLRKLIPRP